MPKIDIIIVGAGPAGVAAAVQCKRLGLMPALFDAQGAAGGLTACANRIENYPGLLPMSGEELARLLREHLQRFDIAVRRGRVTAVCLEDRGFAVSTDNGAYHSSAVAIAVGTEPKRLCIPGSEHVCYSPLDVASGNDLTAAIIGGGEAALDYALSLAAKKISSTILVRGSALKAHGILVERACRNEHIRVLLNAEPKDIQKTGNGLLVRFQDTSLASIHAHWVLAAVGRESSIGPMLDGLDIELSKAVSTSVPGLFVIGDARTGTLGQIGIAVGDGLLAAMLTASFIRTIDM